MLGFPWIYPDSIVPETIGLLEISGKNKIRDRQPQNVGSQPAASESTGPARCGRAFRQRRP